MNNDIHISLENLNRKIFELIKKTHKNPNVELKLMEIQQSGLYLCGIMKISGKSTQHVYTSGFCDSIEKARFEFISDYVSNITKSSHISSIPELIIKLNLLGI